MRSRVEKQDVVRTYRGELRCRVTEGSEDIGSDTRPPPFERAYPFIARWVTSQGWIEIGQDGGSRPLVRAGDVGGRVWEGDSRYHSVDAALQAVEAGLAQWMRQHSID